MIQKKITSPSSSVDGINTYSNDVALKAIRLTGLHSQKKAKCPVLSLKFLIELTSRVLKLGSSSKS